MQTSTKLQKLAERYSCDKLYSHSYIPFYQELFEGRKIERLLEIGIGYEDLMTPFVPRYVHGSSLRMWQDYFPNAEIFACDIRPDTLINEDRIRSIVCDQSNADSIEAMLAEFSTDFDVVIDDGSHVTEHQIFTAKTILPKLSEGSVYVIEDVQQLDTVFWSLQRLARHVSGHPEPIQMCDFGKRPDDAVILIQL